MKSFATLCLLGCAVAVQLCNEGLGAGEQQAIQNEFEKIAETGEVPDGAVEKVGDLIEKKCGRGKKDRKNRDDGDDDDDEDNKGEDKQGKGKKSRKGGKGDREAEDDGEKGEEKKEAGEGRPNKEGLAQKKSKGGDASGEWSWDGEWDGEWEGQGSGKE